MKPLPIGLTLTVVVIFACLIISNSLENQGVALLAAVLGVLLIIMSILMQKRQNRTSRNRN